MIYSLNGSRGPLRAQGRTQEQLTGTQQRLATGRRINEAEDDSAGLSISNRLQGQIRSLTQGLDNADLGLARLDVIGGAMDTADSLLGRATELATRAASDTMSADERAILGEELGSLLAELDVLHGDTSFNGQAVFGDEAAAEVLVEEGGEAVAVEGQNVSADALGLADVSLADAETAGVALEALAGARDRLTSARSSVSDSAVQLRSAGDRVQKRLTGLAGADSRIRDADHAREASELVRLQILSDAGLAAVAQSNTNVQSVLSLLSA